MNPTKGYYRQLLANDFPMVRIAFTHTPIYGCSRVDPDGILRVLDESTDPYAKYYADGIRNGSLAVIVEDTHNYVYKNNGELYFSN